MRKKGYLAAKGTPRRLPGARQILLVKIFSQKTHRIHNTRVTVSYSQSRGWSMPEASPGSLPYSQTYTTLSIDLCVIECNNPYNAVPS